jgi:hypothetical protein
MYGDECNGRKRIKRYKIFFLSINPNHRINGKRQRTYPILGLLTMERADVYTRKNMNMQINIPVLDIYF